MKARNYSHSNVAVRYVEDLYFDNMKPKRYYFFYQKKLYHLFQNTHPNVQKFAYQLILSKAKEMNLSKGFVPRRFKDYLLKIAKIGHRIQQYRSQWISDKIIDSSSPQEILAHLFIAEHAEFPKQFIDIEMLHDEAYFDFIVAVGSGKKIWKWLNKLPFQLNNEEFFFILSNKKPENMWKSVYRATLSTLVEDVSSYEWILVFLEKFKISKTAHRQDIIQCILNNFDTSDKRFISFFNHLKQFYQRYQKHWLWRLKELNLTDVDDSNIYPTLVNNLFAKYPVHKNALRLFNIKFYRDFLWFLHLANGYGVRSIPSFPVQLSKNEAQYFLDYPHQNIQEAHYYSKAKVAGATEKQAIYIAKNLSKNRIGNQDVLQKIIYFLVQHFPNGHFLIVGIIRYILLQFSRDKRFTLKGRTANSIERDTVAFYKNWLRRINRKETINNLHYVMCSTPYHMLLEELKVWVKRPMSNFHFEKEEIRYEIRQINSYFELRAEGRVMHHCVATYANACRTGHCSIWSFSKYNAENRRKRILTLELRNQEIVQAKGTYNKTRVNAKDYEILYQWTKQENLGLNVEQLWLQVV